MAKHGILRNGTRALALKGVPRLVSLVTGIERSAINKPILHGWLELEGPDPEVWDGPIFIHVPKAAGSSVLRTGVKYTLGHKPVRYYLRHKPADRAMPATFAIARDPMDRFVSAFYYLKGGGSTGQDRRWSQRNIAPDMTHNDFAEHLESHPRLLRQMHFRPQAYMLKDDSGKIAVDRILKFEMLDTDWPPFARAHGLVEDLPRVNVGSRGSRVRPETSDRTKEIIARLYAEDFTILGYAPPA